MPKKRGVDKKATGKRPRCHTCDKPIYVPAGWSPGPAVRRHYWTHHREVMQANAKRTDR